MFFFQVLFVISKSQSIPSTKVKNGGLILLFA